MSSEEEDELLPGSPVEDSESDPQDPSDGGLAAASHRQRVLRTVAAVSCLLLALSLLALCWALLRIAALTGQSQGPHRHYSPADDAVEYADTLFTNHFREDNVYVRDPDKEVDSAWTTLYDEFGLSQISTSEARRLPNKTLPADPASKHYIISLSVFHQIHCLDILRKAVYAAHYTDPATGALGGIPKGDVRDHVRHCIDVLRQGAMCAGDVTPVVFRWDRTKQKPVARTDVVHACRDFDKLKEWAKNHQLGHDFDFAAKAEAAG